MKHTLPAFLLLALAVGLATLFACLPLAGTIMLASGVVVQGWLDKSLRILYPALLLAGVAASFGIWRVCVHRLGGTRFACLRHLAWLPTLFLLSYASPWIGVTLSGLVVPLGGTLLAAVCLEEFLRPILDARDSGKEPHRGRSPWILFFVTAFLLYVLWHFSVGPRYFSGGGDVKHYRIQVENLLERGNLDLTDRMNAMMDARGIPPDSAYRMGFLGKSHMRVNAEGRVHSYHSFGFPLLVWPFRLLFGDFGDKLLRVLLGALALVGVRAACLAHGATREASNVVTALTGLSYIWIFTAFSFLPEMLGYCLCVWAFWAIAAQHDPRQRVAATIISFLSCAYLPIAHIRFAPMGLALAGFFGLEGLCVQGENFWRRKFPRLGLFTLACFAGWFALWLNHRTFFSGTAAYSYSTIAGREPLVMWAIFADRRGVVAVVPAIGAYLASLLCAAFRGGAIARRAWMAIITVAGVLYCCCCTPAALSGACMNGRYFYPVVPVLLPFFAISLSRADRLGRVWLLFLSLMPVLYFLFLSFMIRGTGLIRVPAPIRYFPGLHTFWEPYPSFYASGTPEVRWIGTLFAVSVMALSLLAILRGFARVRLLAAGILLIVAFFSGSYVDRADPPKRMRDFGGLMANRHFRHFRILKGHSTTFFDGFHSPESARNAKPKEVYYCLTDNPSLPHDGFHRLQRTTDALKKDWNGRNLRWGTARSQPIGTGKQRGWVALHAIGKVVRGSAHMAAEMVGAPRHHEVPLPEGPFDIIFRVYYFTNNDGANILFALDNNVGEVIVDEFEIVPCPDGLQEVFGPFPEGATVIQPPKKGW